MPTPSLLGFLLLQSTTITNWRTWLRHAINPVHWLTALVMVVLWFVNLLPFATKIAIGRWLGALLYRVNKRRVNIARVNIRLCFPELSEQKQQQMVRESVENFGISIMESVMSWWGNPKFFHQRTELLNPELLEQTLARKNGLLLLGAHFTTLDLTALLFSKYGLAYATYREQNNVILNYVMSRGRRLSLKGMIAHTNMRKTVRLLRKGEIVWYAPDQDMGEENSVYAPFFGQSAATLTTTAKLAKLTGASILFLAAYRRDDNSGYVLKLLPMTAAFPSDDPVVDAGNVNAMIEAAIRLAPSQYYWFHRRFKSQKNLEKSALYN